MNHRTSSRFWALYDELPEDTRILADKRYELLKRDPHHPSLQLKKVGKLWSARVSLSLRVLAAEDGDDLVWFWIGDHKEYERLIRQTKKG